MVDTTRAPSRLTVAQLLALPVVHTGRPHILAGAQSTGRTVRWVHSSEIYDISPLLKGGEVLFTTGLGLVGASDEALRHYVIALSNRSVAALVIEIGRTFTHAPVALVDAANEVGLPLVAMGGVVPFIEITETVHAMLLASELDELRVSRRLSAAIDATLLTGSGLAAVVHTIAEIAGCPVRLIAADGHVVTESETMDAEGGTSEDRWPSAEIEVLGRHWGSLIVCGDPTDAHRLIAREGATTIAVEMTRLGSTEPGAGRIRAGSLLLRDIFGRQFSSADEVIGRAAALGLTMHNGGHAVGFCLAIDPSNASDPLTRRSHATRGGSQSPSTRHFAGSAVQAGAEAALGTALVAELDGSYLIAAILRTDSMRERLFALADAIDDRLSDGAVTAMASGPPVRDIASLGRSLRVAREASVLARRLEGGLRTLRSSDLGVHRLLSRFATDAELAAMVDEQLGPLLDHDARHGSELVASLDMLLAHGLRKTAAARGLGIRRQTLYQRLEKISQLLGGLDFDSRERRTAIDLALVGWRLRTSAASTRASTGQ